MNRFVTLAIALTALGLPTASNACSASWLPGWSPEEILERKDVRRVHGTYRLLQVSGNPQTDQNGQPVIVNAEFRGRIDTLRGTGWNVYHDPPMYELTCTYGMYFKPETDATGTFWISRRKVNGRYRLLLWEGEHLPPEERGEPVIGGE